MILFFNEDPHNSIDTWIQVPITDELSWYDAFDNVLRRAELQDGKVHLRLTPYQGMILCQHQGKYAVEMPENPRQIAEPEEWSLTMIPAGKTEAMTEQKHFALKNLVAADQYPDFSGTMIYETEVALTEKHPTVQIDLGRVYETVEVWVNGKSVGVRVAPPYSLVVDGDLFMQGTNHIRILVVNTLGHQESQRDRFSMTMPQEPVGLMGPVRILA